MRTINVSVTELSWQIDSNSIIADVTVTRTVPLASIRWIRPWLKTVSAIVNAWVTMHQNTSEICKFLSKVCIRIIRNLLCMEFQEVIERFNKSFLKLNGWTCPCSTEYLHFVGWSQLHKGNKAYVLQSKVIVQVLCRTMQYMYSMMIAEQLMHSWVK